MALANRHLISASKMSRIFSSQKLEPYFITGSRARNYKRSLRTAFWMERFRNVPTAP